MKEASSPKKMFHVVIGTPDLDNCPICRAHSKAKVDQVVDDTLGQVLIQELHPNEILRCPCLMCAEARQDTFED